MTWLVSLSVPSARISHEQIDSVGHVFIPVCSFAVEINDFFLFVRLPSRLMILHVPPSAIIDMIMHECMVMVLWVETDAVGFDLRRAN